MFDPIHFAKVTRTPDGGAAAEAMGGQLLGEGCFARVYRHPEDPTKAIKVSHKANDGGVLYAFWARDNQHMLGVPTIHSIDQYREYALDELAITVIVMDLYVATLYECWSTGRDVLGVDAKPLGWFLQNVLDGGSHNDYLGERLHAWAKDGGDMDALRAVAEPYLGTLQAIQQFFRGAAQFDLHEDNVMVDGAGGLVFTDPLSWRRKDNGDMCYDQ